MATGSTTFFVSYAREDADFALRLAKDLRAAGASLWIDQLDIKAGERWDRSIERALETTSGMLLVLSPDSVDSANVQDEVSYALEEGKRVVPVMHRACKLPFRLRRVQFVDFTQDYNTGLKRLLRDLQMEGGRASAEPLSKEAKKEKPETTRPKVKQEVERAVEKAVATPRPDRRTGSPFPLSNWIIGGAVAVVLLLGVWLVPRLLRSNGTEKPVLQRFEVDNRFGYRDRSGRVVIPPEFDAAAPFKNGVAEVRMGDHVFTINRKGECVDRCPEEPPVEEEGAMLEQRAWDDALEVNTLEAYYRYRERFPEGRFVGEAEERIRELENVPAPEEEVAVEDRTWQKVRAENSVYSYNAYLRRYPDGKYAAAARRILNGMNEEDLARAADEFLVRNGRRQMVRSMPSGLQVEVIGKGSGGRRPGPDDRVRIHYEGRLPDGSVFDSSFERGEPAIFAVNGVIPGLAEGLQMMTVGAEFRFYIHYELGYGAKGSPPMIPPYSVMIFEVKLLGIE